MLRGLNLASVVREGFAGQSLEFDTLALKAFSKRYGIDFLYMFETAKRYCEILNKRVED